MERKKPWLALESMVSVFIVLAVSCLAIPASVWAQIQPPAAKEADLTPQQRKIHSLTRSTMARLKAEGIDRSNAARLNAGQRFSSPLIKVDDRARIHLYLELVEVDAARLAALAQTGEAEIEIANAELKLIQAWVPYDKIEAVAALDFVTRVRPPEYATPRTGSVTSQSDTKNGKGSR